MEESENSSESPHLGEIKHMHKQCVPGASLFFACAEDEARSDIANEKEATGNVLPLLCFNTLLHSK